MKKLIIILIFLLIFPLISSIEFDMKTEFDSGETLLAVISGNFLDQITEDNVFFYKGHVRIPVIYDVGKINEDFYIYAMLEGKEQGNYSVEIKDVEYMSGVTIKDDDIVKNFTISENIADFSMNPGFVITTGNFFLEVQNLQEQKITISIETPETLTSGISGDSFELKSGETKKINFELDSEDRIFEEIKLSSINTDYSIPVLVDKPNITEEEEVEFKFEPVVVEVSMATDSDAKRIIYISNIGADTENISISASSLLEPYVEISPEILDLDEDSDEKIEINITSDSEPKTLQGTIIATAENFSASMTLILNFIENYIPTDTDSEIIATTCEQLEGTICGEGESCTGETTPTKDGICCLASCEQIKKSSTGKIIGWAVVIIVILFLFWFFRKYKRVRPKIDLLKIGRGKK